MADLTFYGVSDDLVEVEGVVTEEYPACIRPVTLLVVAPGGRQVLVRAKYGKTGCWEITYAPVDEDVHGIEGRVSVNGHTARLTLDVPEGTKVHRLHRDDAS